MTAANAAADADVITFAIGSGPQTIAPSSPLPSLLYPVTIDAASQPGYAGAPIIELNGAGVGDAASGLTIAGGDSVINGLVINRFNGAGVLLASNNNVVQDSYIGTDQSGTLDRGNGGAGVSIAATSGNFILDNLISHNRASGVSVSGGSGNFIYSLIGGNDGLGIDLTPQGVTVNDAGDGDSGANALQNYPDLISVTAGSGTTLIEGTLGSIPSTDFAIDLYSSPACDPTGYGEGHTPFGTIFTTTDGSGEAFFGTSFSVNIADASFVVATATDPLDSTSEFSACLPAFDDNDDDNDGVADAAEGPCGANAMDGESRPERLDGAFAGKDDDADGQTDEAPPPGVEGYDCDGDGWKGMAENHLYSSAGGRDQDACGNNGWPAELATSGLSANKLTLLDLSSFVANPRKLNTSPGDLGYNVRWDVVPGAPVGKQINLVDVSALIAPSAETANPPMLGGQRAFDGPACPWPP